MMVLYIPKVGYLEFPIRILVLPLPQAGTTHTTIKYASKIDVVA